MSARQAGVQPQPLVGDRNRTQRIATEVSSRPAPELHLQRLAERIHTGGPRLLCEPIVELVSGLPHRLAWVEACARLDPKVLVLLGAEKFPPRPILLEATDE